VFNHEVVLIQDETLIAQLSTRTSTYDSRGRIGIEKKEDLRSRGLKSPDRAEAVVAVFSIRSGVQQLEN
jgi:phage terminase large subunit